MNPFDQKSWWQASCLARERENARQHAFLRDETFEPRSLQSEILRLVRRREGSAQPAAFARCVEGLRADARVRRLTNEERRRLARIAHGTLTRAGIGASGSRLSPLHEDLFWAIGTRFDWQKLHALARTKANEVVRWLADNPAPPILSDQKQRLRWLRWTGNFFQAEAELETFSSRNKEIDRAFIDEERLLQAVGRDGNLAALFKNPSLAKWATLWAFAVPERNWASRTATPPHAFLQAVRHAYNLSVPKPERWTVLLDALESGADEMDAHELALSLAVVVRWLLRNRASEEAKRFSEVYEVLSRALTMQLSPDVLGVFPESGRQDVARSAPPVAWGRAGALSSLSFEVALLLGRTRYASLFGHAEKKKRLKEDEAKALVEITVRHLSEMKGPVMKVGQTASYFGWRLPAISSETLTQLQSSAKPIAADSVVRILERELGRPLKQVFTEFEETPIGVGSIGQVHRARLRTGERVAVKVQFPEIERAIRGDLFLLRLCYPVLRLLSASSMKRDLFDELERQLLQECNYEREAELMESFAREFTSVPGLRFPHVHRALGSRRVLVTEYIEGQTYDEFRRTASQEVRDRASTLLAEFVVRSCCRGIFNSDPHPGNFLFRDGQVVCLDFGGVKQWDRITAFPWAEIIYAGVTNDYALFQKSLEGMRLIADRRNFDARYFFQVYCGGAMGNMAVDERRGMSHEELHAELTGYFNRRYLGHAYFNPAYLFGVRVYTGLISLLAGLGSQVNYFEQIRAICEQTYPSLVTTRYRKGI